MKKVLFLSLLQFFFLGNLFAQFHGSCKEAGDNLEDFFSASIGRIIMITNSRIVTEAKNEQLYNLIQECIDVEKVSKRVIGRSKWDELSDDEKRNFLQEYPKYFVGIFRDIVLSAITGTKNYTYKESKVKGTYDVKFVSSTSADKDFTISLVIDKKDGRYAIIDGKFSEVSVLQSQKNMFDRLYDQNKKVIKEFKAENYIPKKK